MPPPPIDIQLLRSLAELVSETGLSELSLSKGDMEIKMTSASAAAFVPPSPPAGRSESIGHVERLTVRSPMVGTVSGPPGPEKAPLTVGAKVEAGDRLFVIKALHTLNEVVASNAGTIRAILVGEGEPVEYDQPLLVMG